MALVAQGYKNKEMAEKMFISEQTVKNHLHNIFDKLGVSDRLELALYAIHKNLHTAGILARCASRRPSDLVPIAERRPHVALLRRTPSTCCAAS